MKAILFDFDGTLADTTAPTVHCLQFALARIGAPAAPEERVRRSIGMHLRDVLWEIAAIDDPRTLERFERAFLERADLVMEEAARMHDAAGEALATLRSAGLALAVCSSKERWRIERILLREGLLERFDVIVGAEDVHAHKPDPAPLLAALARLDVAREDAVYVGDHRVDAEAAARAGIRFVGVLTGASEAHHFAAHAAEALLPDLSRLAEWVHRARTVHARGVGT